METVRPATTREIREATRYGRAMRWFSPQQAACLLGALQGVSDALRFPWNGPIPGEYEKFLTTPHHGVVLDRVAALCRHSMCGIWGDECLVSRVGNCPNRWAARRLAEIALLHDCCPTGSRG